MKPKERGIAWSAATPSRFFVDDLEDMKAALLKVADEVTIAIPDYEPFVDPKELEAISQTIHELEMRANTGWAVNALKMP